jgi:SAM-dependent methyltransferase
MSNAWNPERYLTFGAERRKPYDDLVALVERRPGMRVVDLGCGPGELTADLAERLDASMVCGVDHDASMLARARAFASERVSFVHGDIARVGSTTRDVASARENELSRGHDLVRAACGMRCTVVATGGSRTAFVTCSKDSCAQRSD